MTERSLKKEDYDIDIDDSEDSEDEEDDDVVPVPERCKQRTCFSTEVQYQTTYQASIKDPSSFWGSIAAEIIPWQTPFTRTFSEGDFSKGQSHRWFLNGKLNASYVCLDRWVQSNSTAAALIWEGDDPSEARRITYKELLDSVCRFSNVLKGLGLKTGEVVAVFMPTCVAAVVAMLSCARLGIPHCSVFVGFSPSALAARINDCHARVLITVDSILRGGRPVFVKKAADDAANSCPCLEHMLVFQQTRWLSPSARQKAQLIPCSMHPGRDLFAEEAMSTQLSICDPVWVESSHPLFILYTSGSTGTPKGIIQSTAGFLVHVASSARLAFDITPGDVFACAADIGWIASHSYSVYGALALGVTSVLIQAMPLYPTPSRYWEIIDRHSVTHFWSTPSALRVLAKHGEEPVIHSRLDSLRVLGTVGEPIDSRTWNWFFKIVGRGRCSIVDSYWLTESGGVLLCPFPGCTPLKPGSCVKPFLGIDCALLDPITFTELPGNSVEGILAIKSPWPGMMIGIVGHPELFQSIYLHQASNGVHYFITGDGAIRDHHGRYSITGRMDDVIKICDQRLGTAEIESALMSHPSVAEAAAVGVPDEIKGQTVVAYVTLRYEYTESDELVQNLLKHVSEKIGSVVVPSALIITRQLPRTRAGKIVRRLLRKIAEKQTSPEQLGDTSTVADASVLQEIIEKSALKME